MGRVSVVGVGCARARLTPWRRDVDRERRDAAATVTRHDAADALAVTFAYPVAHRERTEKPRTIVARDSAVMATGWLAA